MSTSVRRVVPAASMVALLSLAVALLWLGGPLAPRLGRTPDSALAGVPPTKVSVESATVQPGGSVVIDVTADAPAPGIGAYTIDVVYDNTLLTATSCAATPPDRVCNATFAPNVVRFAGSSTAGFIGAVFIGSVTFRAGSTTGASALQVVVGTITDPSEIDLTPGLSVNHGSVTVQAAPTPAPATATPTPTPVVTPTPPAATVPPGPTATPIAPTATATPALWGTTSAYLVFQRELDGTIRQLLHQETVEVDEPLESLTAEEEAARLAVADGGSDRLSVRLKSSTGTIIYRNVLSIPRVQRGEFHLAPGESGLDSHIFDLATVTFVVRVPVVPDTVLNLQLGSGPVQSFDLAAPAVRAGAGVAGGAPATCGAPESEPGAGDPANRLDLLIIGDGYTAGEVAAFEGDAANVVENFFSVTPFSQYRSYVNVHTLFCASPQSGADHPVCADGTPDPLAGTTADTAFDATYCTNGIHRLLTVDAAAVQEAAAAAPDWDAILVIVNDDTYGGSGGAVPVMSTHPFAVEVGQHEFGHSFVGLADEYGQPPYPGYPPCSDVNPGPRPCEPNVTDQSSRAVVKWAAWFATDPSVGLFEGARYQPGGMYRPGDDCGMRTLGKPFCPVASQAYVLKLYNGDWPTGTAPQLGMDLIEPGGERPPPGAAASPNLAGMTLSVEVLEPAGGSVQVSWFVDGVRDASATSSSYGFEPSGPGEYEVRVEAVDATSLVHRDLRGDALESSRTWTVSVPDIQPPPSPTRPPSLEEPGDANCDTSVNSIDAALMLQFDAGLVATLDCEGAADANGDGGVNSLDAALVLQYDAGLLGSLGGGWAAQVRLWLPQHR